MLEEERRLPRTHDPNTTHLFFGNVNTADVCTFKLMCAFADVCTFPWTVSMLRTCAPYQVVKSILSAKTVIVKLFNPHELANIMYINITQ